MGKSWQWSVLCNPSAVGFKSLIWSSSLWLPLQTGPWGAVQGWGLSVLDQLSLCCTQVLAAGEVLHSLVIPVQHTPRDSSSFCGKSFVQRKFSFVFFKLYPPWEREEPVWLRQPLRLTHLCHLWLFPCSQGNVQQAWKIFPYIFWKACSGKFAPALAPSSNLSCPFRAGVLLTTRSQRSPVCCQLAPLLVCPPCPLGWHQLLRACPPQQLPGPGGACVTELAAEREDHKLVMFLSCEAQGQDDTLVFCSIQEPLMEHSQAGPHCQGHWRLLVHPPVLWAGVAFAETNLFSMDQLKSLFGAHQLVDVSG